MKFKAIIIVFALIAGSGLEAWGQAMTNGAFGQRSVGTSLSAGMSSFGGSSAMGGMGMSSMGGMGGMGMSSMGGMGMSSMGGMGSMGGLGSSMGGLGSTSTGLGTSMIGGAQTGQFIGANNQSTFIGGNTLAGTTGQNGMMRGNTGMGTYGGMSGMGGMGGQFGGNRGGMFGQMGGMGMGQNNMNNTQNRNQSQMTITRRVDIEIPAALSNASNNNIQVNSGLNQLLKRTVSNRSPTSSIVASYQGRTVVLKGIVATAQERDLAAKLVRLEPGVDQVQNDLVVKQADTPDSQR
jgi:BON domain